MNIIGYFHGPDPAACLLSDGELVAFVEEERLVRFKHASGIFPIRSISQCLQLGGLQLSEVDCFVYGWDAPRYTSGDMANFYERVNRRFPPDDSTLRWQRQNLSRFSEDSLTKRLHDELVRWFGTPREELPPLQFFPHHASHATAAFLLSPFDQALVLGIDGSGDSQCTTVWQGQGTRIELLDEVEIPHSLGWFYAAMTEYLGFKAYDGEYKVMGLAAYGRKSSDFRSRLEAVVRPGPRGWDYEVDPKFIHHGQHSYSDRFTDRLAEHLGLAPRLGDASLESIHQDLAFEVQRALEEHVLRLVRHFRKLTGQRNLCIGGGVGLNVKMNSRLYRTGLFDAVWPFPIPNDSGCSIGAALGIHLQEVGAEPQPLSHLHLGPDYDEADIEFHIRSSGIRYRRPRSIAEATAELLAEGKVVAWFQGRLEGGPRALGGRSILADPRSVESRDRVNGAIKFREYWRPFCPSLTLESAARYLKQPCAAPYMILAFEATELAASEIPAVVHVDQTMRAQTVDGAGNPAYYEMLRAFERRTGVPVVLNTSFNVKGEAIVCSPRDALRTFWSTGLDALALGPFLIEKPVTPVSTEEFHR